MNEEIKGKLGAFHRNKCWKNIWNQLELLEKVLSKQRMNLDKTLDLYKLRVWEIIKTSKMTVLDKAIVLHCFFWFIYLFLFHFICKLWMEHNSRMQASKCYNFSHILAPSNDYKKDVWRSRVARTVCCEPF